MKLKRFIPFVLVLLGISSVMCRMLAPEETVLEPTLEPSTTPLPTATFSPVPLTNTPLPPTPTSTPISIPGIDKPIIVNDSGFTGELQILNAHTQESLGSGDSATYPDDRSNVFLLISFTPDLREWIPNNIVVVCDARRYDQVSSGYVFDNGVVSKFYQFYVVPGDLNFPECILQLSDDRTIPLATFFGDESLTSGTTTDTNWQSLNFTIPIGNKYWSRSADNSYTAIGMEEDTFIWTEETFEGDLSLSFDMEILYGNNESGGGCILVFGNGVEWSKGTLIFCVNGAYQAIQVDTVYESIGFLDDANISLQDDHTYSFTIEIVGDKASLYLEDEEIVSVSLPTHVNRNGQIGLYKYWAVPEVTISDIKVKVSSQ